MENDPHTGVFMHQTDKGYRNTIKACTLGAGSIAYEPCWVCGKRVTDKAVLLLVDVNTDEVMDPSCVPEDYPCMYRPIGSECLRRHPGAARFEYKKKEPPNG